MKDKFAKLVNRGINIFGILMKCKLVTIIIFLFTGTLHIIDPRGGLRGTVTMLTIFIALYALLSIVFILTKKNQTVGEGKKFASDMVRDTFKGDGNPISKINEILSQNEKYEKKKGTDQYGFITKCGVKVKSKSELIIADNLYYNNIPYKYERPMKLKGIVVHPDFTILNTKTRREVIWEHFGMMDNPEYAQTAVRKKQDYNFEGYFEGDNLIITMETKNAQLNSKQIEMIIQRKFLSNIN